MNIHNHTCQASFCGDNNESENFISTYVINAPFRKAEIWNFEKVRKGRDMPKLTSIPTVKNDIQNWDI